MTRVLTLEKLNKIKHNKTININLSHVCKIKICLIIHDFVFRNIHHLYSPMKKIVNGHLNIPIGAF